MWMKLEDCHCGGWKSWDLAVQTTRKTKRIHEEEKNCPNKFLEASAQLKTTWNNLCLSQVKLYKACNATKSQSILNNHHMLSLWIAKWCQQTWAFGNKKHPNCSRSLFSTKRVSFVEKLSIHLYVCTQKKAIYSNAAVIPVAQSSSVIDVKFESQRMHQLIKCIDECNAVVLHRASSKCINGNIQQVSIG